MCGGRRRDCRRAMSRPTSVLRRRLAELEGEAARRSCILLGWMVVGREVARSPVREVRNTSNLKAHIRCWRGVCSLIPALRRSEEGGWVHRSAAAYHTTVEEHQREQEETVKDLPASDELAEPHADASKPPETAARWSR